MKRLGGRLFLAVELDDGLRRSLVRQLAERFDAGRLPGRNVAPERWHWTLKFLGRTDDEQARALFVALERAELVPGFELELGGLGAFPQPERARVLWLGCAEGGDALEGLARRVEVITTGEGFAAEPRPFSAHLTLSRLRPPADLTDLVATVPPLEGRMRVDAVTLMRSHLRPAGPSYETLGRWPLHRPRPASSLEDQERIDRPHSDEPQGG